MNNSNFNPNWASKTTRNRLNKILSFAEDYFIWNNSERSLHSEKVKMHFGQTQHKLNKYFIDHLLYKTDSYSPGAKSYTYNFSWNNLLYFFQKSGLISEEEITKVGIKQVQLKKKREKIDSICLLVFQENKCKTFFDAWSLERNWSELKFQNAEYKIDEFTLRRTHPFQNKSKAARSMFWEGWYDYDVESCAYTLVHQHLVNTVLPWWGKTQIDYEYMRQVYANKKAVRNRLMLTLEIDEECVKVLLSGLLFNAKLICFSKTKLYKKLVSHGYNAEQVIKKAKSDEFIQKLIAELRSAWPKMMIYWNRQNGKSCRKYFREEKIDTETGEITKKKFNPARVRSRIYFELERQVSNQFSFFMKNKVCHLIHDGFFSPDQIDMNELKELIKLKTGFEVNISESKL